MKQIKYIFFLLIGTLYAISNGYAQSEADFIRLVKEFTYKPNGEFEFHYNKILKLKTHKAFNSLYGETFVVYNPDFQELKINESYTRQADGTLIQAPQNAFNEVLPSTAADAPAYNHIKEMVITHTGLELGATIYLDYTLSSKPSFLSTPDIDEVLQELSPVKEYVLIVNIPENQELHYTLSASKVKPEITVKEGMKSYRWKLKNIPAAISEPYQSSNKYDVPRLTACTYTSVNQALSLFQKNLLLPIDPKIKEFTRQLVQNAATEKDKLIAVYEYITKNISTIGLTPENLAYTSRPPFEVLESAYGTKTEKADLFIAMLKSIDLKPAYVIVYPETLKDKIKGIKPRQDIFVKVETDSQPYFLSPDQQNTTSLETIASHKEVWVVREDQIQNITPSNPAKMTFNCDADIHFTDEGVHTSASITTSGNTLNDLMPAFSKQYKSTLTRNFGTLINSEILHSDPNQMEIKFSSQNTLQQAGDYLLYNLPVLPTGIHSWQLNMLNSDRKTALELPYLLEENYEYTIHLPENKDLKNKNIEIHLKNKAGSVDISLKQENKTVKIKKNLILSKRVYQPSSQEYGQLRELITSWLSNGTEDLIIR